MNYIYKYYSLFLFLLHQKGMGVDVACSRVYA